MAVRVRVRGCRRSRARLLAREEILNATASQRVTRHVPPLGARAVEQRKGLSPQKAHGAASGAAHRARLRGRVEHPALQPSVEGPHEHLAPVPAQRARALVQHVVRRVLGEEADELDRWQPRVVRLLGESGPASGGNWGHGKSLRAG